MKWTDEKKAYLEKNYGTMNIKALEKKLGTTLFAIRGQANKQGLGGAINNSGLITVKELASALGCESSKIFRWIKKFNFTATKINVTGDRKFWRIRIETFWEWAETHRELIDFNKFELGGLGKEPTWVAECRGKKATKDRTRWSKSEDNQLIALWNDGMTTQQIADRIGRKYNGVIQRARKLKLKNKMIEMKWQEKELKMLLDMLDKGMHNKDIAWELGRDKSQILSKKRNLIKNGIIKTRYKAHSEVYNTNNRILPVSEQNATTEQIRG